MLAKMLAQPFVARPELGIEFQRQGNVERILRVDPATQADRLLKILLAYRRFLEKGELAQQEVKGDQEIGGIQLADFQEAVTMFEHLDHDRLVDIKSCAGSVSRIRTKWVSGANRAENSTLVSTTTGRD